MTSWTQLSGDYRHTGVRRDATGPRQIDAAWTADLVGRVGSPVLDRDAVFVGTRRGNCYAFDRETGHRRWVFETTAATETAPIVTRDRLYFGTDDGTIYALDPATGDQYWATAVPAPLTATLVYSDATGDLYAGHENGLTALDGTSGGERWTTETETAATGSPAIGDDRELERDQQIRDLGLERLDRNHADTSSLHSERERRTWDGPRLYAATAGGTVECLGTETGTVIWSAPTNGDVPAGPTIAGGRVYVADDGGTLLALNADTGQTWFSYSIADEFTSGVAVLAEEGMTIVGAADGYAHVTDTTVGRRKRRGWLFSKKGVALDGTVSASPVIAGTVLCVGDTTGSLYGIDLADDWSHRWHAALEGAITNAPALADQRLYVGSDDRLTCFEWPSDDASTS
ncbi:outer membrane protein assembly factor BamB family protein [Natrialba asiatica]|uniref:Pyrrolo-quinoline quinone n=1 Tax=Natrialba asiatica (strain ATCC 700177 / DSM 12278 / JCM 9576 / FERM P-10747 / NBRC 102637 / 172P1) TaxID=29540 RepID=M0AGK0_NATA1|nr:PQQ-binding-like beta-propeller repeat protein [Natrialba asiatica]ELY97860.1 pyrrolo-quinoline quinone [Natrialba asiatica DSM 12278]